jgi:hypothetical protein
MTYVNGGRELRVALSSAQKGRGYSNMHRRTSIPIVPQIEPQIDPVVVDRIPRLARRLLADEPALANTDMFDGRVASGLTGAPGLFVEDHSQMALFSGMVDTPYEYRARLLAGDGDFVAITGRRYPAFEAYCRDWLGLGTVEFVTPAPARLRQGPSVARRCARDEGVLDRLAAAAREHGGLQIVPYIGMGDAWRLAAAIAERAATPVHVAAPPPRLTRRANDKLWFAACVTALFDRTALPLTYAAYGPAALAAKVRAVARRHARVVVKVPDSSGSMGNLVFASDDIRQTPLAALRRRLTGALWSRGWRDAYPLMVSVWDAPVLASPSVDLWIPAGTDGPPAVEGVFTQMVAGEAGEFVGAEPSPLPDELNRLIAGEALAIGLLFQKLGYFGRCSFDAVVVGDAVQDAALHWIECNGRWGGVSTPMTLANRLIGDWSRRPFVVVQQTHMAMPSRSFREIRARLEPLLFRRGKRDSGIVLLLPGRLTEGTGLNFMALGRSLDEARGFVRETTERLAADQAD